MNVNYISIILEGKKRIFNNKQNCIYIQKKTNDYSS